MGQKLSLSSVVLFSLHFVFVSLAPAATRARIVSANTSSGPRPTYDSGEGIRMFQGLRPDIALIQEFNFKNNSTADIRQFVDTAFTWDGQAGRDFHVCRDNRESHTIPNGIVSRFRILECNGFADSSISNREYTYARIQIPGGKDLWAFSLHLKSGDAQGTRADEARELSGILRDRMRLPTDAYIVLGGDFNTGSRNEEAITIFKRAGFVDTHIPVGAEGKPGTNASRSKPYDWVFPNAALNTHHVAVAIGNQRFPHGLVFDSRTFSPLSLVRPVLQDDSRAQNMQHMPVVKDYSLPE